MIIFVTLIQHNISQNSHPYSWPYPPSSLSTPHESTILFSPLSLLSYPLFTTVDLIIKALRRLPWNCAEEVVTARTLDFMYWLLWLGRHDGAGHPPRSYALLYWSTLSITICPALYSHLLSCPALPCLASPYPVPNYSACFFVLFHLMWLLCSISPNVASLFYFT